MRNIVPMCGSRASMRWAAGREEDETSRKTMPGMRQVRGERTALSLAKARVRSRLGRMGPGGATGAFLRSFFASRGHDWTPHICSVVFHTVVPVLIHHVGVRHF